jgi:F0F1-type ATP synthase membrane subunit a
MVDKLRGGEQLLSTNNSMASSETVTSSEFIRHHLTNLTFGRHADGQWGMAQNGEEASQMGVMAIHVDSLFWSFVLGALFLWMFRKVAISVTSGEPGMMQNFCEWIVEFIDNNVRDSFRAKHDLVAPMALTLFCWVFLMNLMDLIPVEVIPRFLELFEIHFQKVVPSTDPNITFGLALSVFALMIYYSIMVKGIGGFAAELTMHPFESKNIAAVRKLVRRGDDFYSNLVDVRCRHHPDIVRWCAAVHLGSFSYFNYYIAGFYIYGFDNCIHGYGPPASLRSGLFYNLTKLNPTLNSGD